MLKENVNEKYFFCYDRNLSNYLYINGCKYITRANNIKDGAQFALFEKTDKVRELIDQWANRKAIYD